jgi:uncharacterized protein (TIGR03067 family)
MTALWTLMAGLALAAADPEVRKDEDRLQGTWKVTSIENDGKKADPKTFAGWKLVVAGNKMTALDGNDVVDDHTFTLAAAAKPPALDLVPLMGEKKAKTVKGIYRLEGDTLTVCVSEPDAKERPKEFRSVEGTSHTLVVFQRAKP